MERIIESINIAEYKDKTVDASTSEIFIRALDAYMAELRRALEPIFNRVFSADTNVLIDCAKTIIGPNMYDDIFPTKFNTNNFVFKTKRYLKEELNNDKDAYQKELDRALNYMRTNNTVAYMEYLEHIKQSFDVVAYIKALRYVDNANCLKYSKYFNIDLSDRNIRNIIARANETRNTISHLSGLRVEDFKSVESMLEEVEACKAFANLFDGNLFMEKHKSNLNRYLRRCINVIKSEPLPFSVISTRIPFFSDEKRLLNTYVGADYREAEKVLYGHSLEELENLVSDLLEDNSPLTINDNEETIIPKNIDIKLPTLLNCDKQISHRELTEALLHLPFFVDGKLFLNERDRKLLYKELVPVLKSTGKFAMINYSSRLELNRMSIDGDEIVKKNAEHARATINYLIGNNGIKYTKKQGSIYRKSYLETIDIANRYPKQRFFIMAYDKLSADKIEEETANCLVIRPIGHDHFVLGTKSKLILEDFVNNELYEEEIIQDNSINNDSEEEVVIEKETIAPELVNKDIEIKKDTTLSNDKEELSAKKIKPFFPKDLKCIPEAKELLKVDTLPKEGNIVYNDNESYLLGKLLGQGGEGTIYEVSDNLVAKIYNEEHLTNNRYEKLKLMVETPFTIAKSKKICWPLKLLFDKNDCFVGYLMRKAPSNYKTIGESVINITKKEVLDYYPALKNWNRKSLVGLCKSIAYVFKELHDNGLVVGDINGGNILVDLDDNKGNSILFVDTDSFQVGPYPCPVGVTVFTSPEIYRREKQKQLSYGTFLRTIQDDEYALASLLFQILMFGQVPFNGKGADDELEALMEYNFAFRTDDNSGADTPDGPYRMIWNNTPRDVRNDFEKVFTGKGSVSALEWYQHLGQYSRNIKPNKFTDELTPYRYFDPNHSYTIDFKCENCGREANLPSYRYQKIMERHYFKVCTECNNLMEQLRYKYRTVDCDTCGNKFKIDEYGFRLKIYNKWPLVCPDCRKIVKTTCHICGAPVEIEKYRYNKYNGKLLCKECMEKKR